MVCCLTSPLSSSRRLSVSSGLFLSANQRAKERLKSAVRLYRIRWILLLSILFIVDQKLCVSLQQSLLPALLHRLFLVSRCKDMPPKASVIHVPKILAEHLAEVALHLPYSNQGPFENETALDMQSPVLTLLHLLQ